MHIAEVFQSEFPTAPDMLHKLMVEVDAAQRKLPASVFGHGECMRQVCDDIAKALATDGPLDPDSLGKAAATVGMHLAMLSSLDLDVWANWYDKQVWEVCTRVIQCLLCLSGNGFAETGDNDRGVIEIVVMGGRKGFVRCLNRALLCALVIQTGAEQPEVLHLSGKTPKDLFTGPDIPRIADQIRQYLPWVVGVMDYGHQGEGKKPSEVFNVVI